MKENKGEQPEQENPFKKWLATKDGKDCMKRATFLSDKELDYLENRLWYAFTAGMGEMAELITPAQPSKVQEELKKENELLEAREVAWQNKHSFLMEEIRELKAWKESAISVMPDMQAIGKALNIPLGQSVHDKILPGIERLKKALEVAQHNQRLS